MDHGYCFTWPVPFDRGMEKMTNSSQKLKIEKRSSGMSPLQIKVGQRFNDMTLKPKQEVNVMKLCSSAYMNKTAAKQGQQH